MTDLRKKYEALKKSGIRTTRRQNNLPESAILLKRELVGDYQIGKFNIADFKKLFPLYLPFFPSVINDAEEMLFLDLETTSLSLGAGNIPFLIGLGKFGGGKFVVIQYLITSPPQEYDVLLELIELWKKVKVVITFNGKTFDIPLLTNRCILYRIKDFEAKKQYDLYQLVRSLVRPANLHNVEKEFLGLERDSGLEGREIPALYFNYLQSGDIKILKPVIDRNFQDIVSLPAILYRWVELKNPLFFSH